MIQYSRLGIYYNNRLKKSKKGLEKHKKINFLDVILVILLILAIVLILKK